METVNTAARGAQPFAALRTRIRQVLLSLLPGRVRVGPKERLRSCAGAGLGILMTGLISVRLAHSFAPEPWMFASVGASAVLVFAVPASPLAQPWAVIGGNTISALIGMLCAWYVPDPAWAGAAAVALSIFGMFSLRCLHPPGGGTALLAALAPASWQFLAFPVLTNAVLLVCAGILYNTLTGRRYPHSQQPRQQADAPARFTASDLDAAMVHYNQVLDVSRDDLEDLLQYAELAAYRRTLGNLRCMDIMTPEPLTVAFGTPLDEAWTLLRQRRVKALPVVDLARRIVGIVTVADFMRHANLDQKDGFVSRLKAFVRRTGNSHSSKPEAVGQIMTRQVRVVSHDRPVIEPGRVIHSIVPACPPKSGAI